MKILILCNHYTDAIGGAEIQCDIIAEGLVGFGHEVLYLSPCKGNKNIVNFKSYKLLHCDGNKNEIIKSVSSYNPDIIYWRAHKRDLLETSRALKLNYKLIFAVSALHDVSYKAYYQIFLKNFTLKSYAKFIKNSLVTYRQIKSYQNFDCITFLNNDYKSYIDHSYKITIRDSMDVSYEHEFDWPRPYILWVANIKPTKRPEDFIDLAKQFENYGCDFIMVGRYSKEHSEYSYILDKTLLPNNLFFLGEKTLEQVNAMVANCLFHVHTCEPEGFGNIFIQAWLLGKPSISLNFDPEDLISNNNLGFYANQDKKKFINQTRQLMKDHSLIKEKGSNAKELAEKLFSKEGLIRSLDEVFNNVINSDMI